MNTQPIINQFRKSGAKIFLKSNHTMREQKYFSPDLDNNLNI